MSSSEFLQKAATGGIAEVQMGQLAASRSQNPVVQEFGNRMVQDHSRANDQLMNVAHQLGKHVSTSLDAKHRAKMAKMSKLSGPAFDRAYADDMVEDHVMDVGEFRKAAKSADLRAVREFASQTLPTLESHLQHARSMKQQVEQGGGQGYGNWGGQGQWGNQGGYGTQGYGGWGNNYNYGGQANTCPAY